MSVIYTGKAAPLDGKRKLSGKEAQQRAKAMACVRSPHKTECQGQVYVGLFFDGTGNNHEWVEEHQTKTQRQRNKHSNVARLWDAHLDEPKNGFFSYYMQGVGTPFKKIGDTFATATSVGGNGFAYMGADRINWGITSIFNAVHTYLTEVDLISEQEQKTLVNLMSIEMLRSLPVISSEGATRWLMLTALEEKLAGVVKSHQRKVKQINISIFGFSRGAAQARACAHWLHQIFESETGAFELAGIPIRIGFMGIFDTVAAVGVGDVTPVTFGHMAWADGTQSIHPAVEDCAHFVALHEQRGSFPLEAATGRGNIAYPGMHSDVGGGYWPGEQGKCMPEWGDSPHLSQIPLMDMHFAAIKAGVPLWTIEEIKRDPKLAASFSSDAKLLAIYNKWLSSNGIKPAGIAEFIQAHTKQYLRWRGLLHANGKAHIASKRFYKEANANDKLDLGATDEEAGIMLRAWKERQEANATWLGYAKERAKDVLFVDSGKDPLSAHESKFLALMTEAAAPPDASVSLFEDYVHDSRAGFHIFGKPEPLWLVGGYARYRHVFLQSQSNSAIYSWANESLKAVKAAADASVTFFQSLYDYSVETYKVVRTKIVKTTQQVHDQVVETAEQVRDTAIKTAQQVHDKTVHAAHLAYDHAVKMAGEVNDAAIKARDSAIQTAHQVHERAVKTAQQVHDEALDAGTGLTKTAKATGKQIIRDANEAARLYHQAERRIVLKYVNAQNEWHAQLKQRWNKVK